jgi:hypothetical protein
MGGEVNRREIILVAYRFISEGGHSIGETYTHIED